MDAIGGRNTARIDLRYWANERTPHFQIIPQDQVRTVPAPSYLPSETPLRHLPVT
jgi:hypothetical protein